MAIRSQWSSNATQNTLQECDDSLNTLSTFIASLLGRMNADVDRDQLGSLIEQEMKAMDKAIQAAAERIRVR
jgi:hypothetical protein